MFVLIKSGLVPRGIAQGLRTFRPVGAGLDRGQVTVYTLDAIAQVVLGFKENEDQVFDASISGSRRCRTGSGERGKCNFRKDHSNDD